VKGMIKIKFDDGSCAELDDNSVKATKIKYGYKTEKER
jgi:hypothetical protein